MIRSSVTKRRCRILATLGLALLLFGRPAAVGAAGSGPSGLPLPRFVSILVDKVNLRTGPGVRYPVAWVFVRANLPVLVTLEFENWRKVRDLDGAEGWVHRSLLTGRRHGVITGQLRLLRRAPRPDSPTLLRAEPGVVGRLLACREGWCRMEIDEIDGWLPQAHLFGALVGESFE